MYEISYEGRDREYLVGQPEMMCLGMFGRLMAHANNSAFQLLRYGHYRLDEDSCVTTITPKHK